METKVLDDDIGILLTYSSSVVKKLLSLLTTLSTLVNQLIIDGLHHTHRCFAGTYKI
jgi:hypothetical protein